MKSLYLILLLALIWALITMLSGCYPLGVVKVSKPEIYITCSRVSG
jgi:hypothetical protein